MDKPLKARRRVVLAGGSGFLGRHLANALTAQDDEVVVLTRGAARHDAGVRFVHWDGATTGPWVNALDGAVAVVHLAGQRVDCRPTRRNIDELVRSRVASVRAVGQALRRVAAPPPVWVQCATLAIHGDTGDRVIDEATPVSGAGPPQMVQVALAWEHAYAEATRHVKRAVLLRTGIAIGGGDPALSRLWPLVRAGLGGPVAGGRQWVSWIALEDALRIMLRAIGDPTMHGLYHACAPVPVTNAEMMATLRRHAGRRLGLPAPRPLVHAGAWLLGSDPELALTSRRAVPRRLLEEDHEFRAPTFEEAATRALERTPRPQSAPVPR